VHGHEEDRAPRPRGGGRALPREGGRPREQLEATAIASSAGGRGDRFLCGHVVGEAQLAAAAIASSVVRVGVEEAQLAATGTALSAAMSSAAT
jgi:hypothetical protein